MSHDQEPPSEGGELIPAAPESDGKQGLQTQDEPEAIQQLVELERSRIDRDNRRTEVIAKALELEDDRDKRHFEFASEGQRLEDRAGRQRFILAWSLAAGALAALFVMVGLMLWMAFFGDEMQRTMAQDLGKNGLIGLAGFGVVSGLVRLVRSLMRS